MRTPGGRTAEGTAPPANPRAPVQERGAEALTTRAAGPPPRDSKGGATASAPKRPAQSVPSSAPPQRLATQRGLTTRKGPRLQAASFKSEPKWEFEENYSFDVGGLQTVSFPGAPTLSPRL